jgi:hypothetical protein
MQDKNKEIDSNELTSLDAESLDTATGGWGGHRHRHGYYGYGYGYGPRGYWRGPDGYSVGWGRGGMWMAYRGPGFVIRSRW